MKRFKFKNQIVTDYVSALLVLFIVLFIISACLLGYSVRFSNAQNERNSLLQLQRTQEQVDRSLDFLSGTAMRLSADSRLLRFDRYDPKNSNDIYDAIMLSEALTAEVSEHEFCVGFYVYCREANVILYSNRVYTPQEFFRIYVNEGQFETWKRKLGEGYADSCYGETTAFNDKTTDGTFEYRQSYPYSGSSRGTIVFVINKDIFKQNNVSAEKQKNAVCMYAFNRDNELLYQTEEEDTAVLRSYLKLHDGCFYTKGLKKALICRTTGDRGRISYLYVDKGSTTLLTAKRISRFLTLYIVFGLLGGSLYIYMQIQKVMKRSARMKEFLKGEATDDSPLDWNKIIGSLEELSHKNSRLDRLLSVKNDMDINRHFVNLLHDYSEYSEQSKKALQELGINFDAPDYMLVMGDLNISKEEKPELVKYAIQNVLKDLMGNKVQWYFIDYNWNRVLFLLTGSFDENLQNDMRDVFDMLAEFIRSILSVEVHFDFGAVCHSIDEIRLSVRRMLDYYYYYYYGEATVTGAQTSGGIFQYAYLQSQENELISLILSGTWEETEKFLQQLFVQHHKAGSGALRILFFNLLGTLLKCSEKICGLECMQEQDLSVVLYSQDVSEVENAIIGAFRFLSEHVQRGGENKHLKGLGMKLMSYVDINFADPDLSLKTLSSEFDITISYASKIFKEQIGNNFSDYLTAKRIEKAKQLLKETDMSVSAIAQKTGYVDSSTFIKNFKKVTRMTPGAYRGMQ